MSATVEREAGGLRCSEVLERLSAWVDGELDAADATRIRAHLDSCDTCTRFGADFQELIRQFRAGAGPRFDTGRGARLREVLRARLRSADDV